MKKYKVRCLLALALVLMLTICMPVMASSEKELNNEVMLDRGEAYYDASIGAYVIAFTRNDDTINYLTEAEVYALEMKEMSPEDDRSIEEVEMVPYDYREWYTFTPSGSKTKSNGTRRKVSADFVAPNAGGAVTKNISFTVSNTFSANVTTSSEKSAIQAGAGFTWVKSATASTTYTANLAKGEKGYLSFTPYYNKISGNLKLYSNWDGLIKTKSATGYSVKKTSDGEPDGLYKFIYI